MATAEPGGPAMRAATPGARPGGASGHAAGAVGPPSGRSASGALRLGERTPATVEKRGPYMVTRAPSIQAKLQKHRDLAKAVLRRKGMLGSLPNRPDSSGKRSQRAPPPLCRQFPKSLFLSLGDGVLTFRADPVIP
uniref:protein FAM219B-like n=1 Tax=Ictidomys tridecemlineatus TaxID=43179 RepID=UPI00038BE586|nr:protein FAM219B-like [Ictidomys tridecemlineatus]